MFGLGGHRKASRDPSPPSDLDDGWVDSPPNHQADTLSGQEELKPLLLAIEALAIRLYADHGLPEQPGHYRRHDDSQDWELVSAKLTPAQKFDLILGNPDDAPWRYSTFDALGLQHPNPHVRMAAALLGACRGISSRLEAGGSFTAQTLADALRMGATYQALAQAAGYEAADLRTLHAPPPDAAGPQAEVRGG